MKKILFVLLIPLPLFCNPQGPGVLAGSAAFCTPQERTLRIEASDHTIISWDSFSIGAGETTHFLQPSSQSAVLNHVSGGDPSTILGTLQANGQVYLINPNGLFVGKEAVIDTTSFIASTFNLPDEEFLAGGALHFSGDSTATLTNCGTILAKDGSAVLIGYKIDNQGSISGQNTILAAAKEVVLTQTNSQLLSVHIPVSEISSVQTIAREIEESGNFLSLAIQITDRENASELVEQGGRLLLTGVIYQTGSIEAETLAIHGEKILSAGPLAASREISIDAGSNYIETTAAKLTAPSISIQAEGRLFTSGNYVSEGGSIALLGDDIVLAAAQIDASGSCGGKVFIEGSSLLLITGPSSIKADALTAGDGGKIILLSEGTTRFSGIASAQGGSEKGDGGFIEISGEHLYCSGSPSVRAPHGASGTLLLDPFDIAIDVDDPGGGFPYFDLIDPTQGSGSGFGFSIVPLSTGNVVVSNQNDNFAAPNAGAAYLYNGLTGALISTLTGSISNDQVGESAAALANGNFVVSSPSWNNGTPGAQFGAATWGSGITGISGQVSTLNSLYGTTTGDLVSDGGTTALTNGNYVVSSSLWNNGTPGSLVGAATWGDGTMPTASPVSTSNSLYGSLQFSQVGQGIVALTNGNYIVTSPFWGPDMANITAGAVTWGDGSTGTVGAVGIGNSIYSLTVNDLIGSNSPIALANGNYVVLSPNWSNGAPNSNFGAATWADGTMPTAAEVSTSNSLYGTTLIDQVGSGGLPLTNNNYVVLSPHWTNGIGAATWGDGGSGITGPVTMANSLYGTTPNTAPNSGDGDQVGSRGLALTNGNYVVISPNWNDAFGAGAGVGAATWGDGGGGTIGPVAESNSLFGTVPSMAGMNNGDQIGGGKDSGTALVNGNYVVTSPNWNDNMTAGSDFGAATWGNGEGGTIGPVAQSNSLFGTTVGDGVGVKALALANGNYVVLSPEWNNSIPGNQIGAATWSGGSTGITGPVTTANSLYGTNASDFVGNDGIPLANGDYVVLSAEWNNSMGAATWGNGATGITGPVTTDNSIVGIIFSSGLNEGTDNPFTSPATFLVPFNNDNVSGRIAVSLEDPTFIPFAFGAPQNVTISPGFIAEILNAGSSLTLQADNNINFNSAISVSPPTAVSFTGYAKNNININADIGTTGGALNLTLVANQNILSTSSFTIDTGSGNLVLVADNANPVSPEIGTGFVSLPRGTLSSTGKIQIFTASQPLNTLPATINGAAFIPGPQFFDTRTERWGVYFPSSFGGVPFTIFYKDTLPVKPYVHFLTQISNTANSFDVDWISFIWDKYDEDPKLIIERK